MALPTNANVGYVSGWFMDGAGTVVAGVVTFTPSPVKVDDDTAAGHPVTILPKAIKITLGGDGGIPTTAAATAAGKVGQELLSSEDLDLRPSMWTWQASFEFVGVGNPPPFSFSLPVDGQVNLTTAAPLSSAGGTIIVQGVPSGGTTGQILAKKTSTSYDTEWIAPPSGGGGGGTWGSITGTLASQTDLQTALNGKAATSHTHVAANVTDFSEAVDDRVAALLVAGANVTLTYNDAAGTLTVASSGGGGGSTAWADITGKPSTFDPTIGTTSTTAKAGDYAPAWSDVTSKPAVIAAGADAGTARSAIGAGTSSLAIGTSSTTAMAGNKTATDLGGVTGTGITAIVKLTQAAYDAIVTKDATTLYVVV